MSNKKPRKTSALQQETTWGAKVIDLLAADLQEEFPDMGGLFSRNLLSMKLFAQAFLDDPIAKQPVSQLLWGHAKLAGELLDETEGEV